MFKLALSTFDMITEACSKKQPPTLLKQDISKKLKIFTYLSSCVCFILRSSIRQQKLSFSYGQNGPAFIWGVLREEKQAKESFWTIYNTNQRCRKKQLTDIRSTTNFYSQIPCQCDKAPKST